MSDVSSNTRFGNRKVLIVEDEEAMSIALKDGFESEGYDVLHAADGLTGLKQAQQVQPDLIILDVMLPKMNGLDVCKQLRGEGNGVPIIMLTARGQEVDKVLGLKLGADDYVTKPFSLIELLARAESVLRRSSGGDSGSREEKVYAFGSITVNLDTHEATKGGDKLELSAREFMLMGYLIENRGKVISRDELLQAVWGYEGYSFTRTVDTHVAKLRKKIEDEPHDPQYLLTVHRFGYKFVG